MLANILSLFFFPDWFGGVRSSKWPGYSLSFQFDGTLVVSPVKTHFLWQLRSLNQESTQFRGWEKVLPSGPLKLEIRGASPIFTP